MTPQFDRCRAARVPRSGLASLAPLRRLQGVHVVESADSAWITWDGELASVVLALQAAPGVAFYLPENGHWRRVGSALPEFSLLQGEESLGLEQIIIPAPVSASAPPTQLTRTRLEVSLVPCHQPHPATAMCCSVDALKRWGESATAHEIEQLNGAVCGERVWLRGEHLPALPRAERFWGKRVLSPLGARPEPDWPEEPLRLAAHVDDGEILVLTADGPEAVPDSAFGQLTRSMVRRLVETTP